MSKFRVMIVKKNGQPVGVRAAQINGRFVYLALRDEPEQMTWDDAVKVGIPTKEEWMAIAENLDDINRAFVQAGKKPLEKGWYWSSSEESIDHAWAAILYGGLGFSPKRVLNYVLPILAL